MIPESKGATLFGIFLLADSFLKAALAADRVAGSLTKGPTRLLCYHASELFLKCFLRARGQDIPTLRDYGHNLHQMALSAQEAGLALPKAVLRKLAALAEKNDYVRVRYMVVEVHSDLSSKNTIALTESIRKSVRLALNMDEFGHPQS